MRSGLFLASSNIVFLTTGKSVLMSQRSELKSIRFGVTCSK